MIWIITTGLIPRTLPSAVSKYMRQSEEIVILQILRDSKYIGLSHEILWRI
jgi:hypothetical protein